MSEVKITYETLFDLLRREKSREELQELDSTFYSDVIDYLTTKSSLMKSEDAQSGLFGASESEKIRIQVQNIKKIVKELYDRRIVKIIRLAINRSKVGATIAHVESMLPEEKSFFDNAFNLLNSTRDSVLSKILYFGQNGQRVPQAPAPSMSSTAGGASSLASSSVQTSDSVPKSVEPVVESQPETSSSTPVQTPNLEQNQTTNPTPNPTPTQETTQANPDSPAPAAADPYDELVSVRFKAPIPKFIGKRLESYGPFQAGDEAKLPRILANILLKKNAVDEI